MKAMRVPVLAMLQIVLMLLAPAAALAQQTPVADPELFEMKHFRKLCGQVDFGSDFVKKTDFNNDGIPDMIVNEGEINCDGHAQFYCDDEGCPYNFYVQGKEGGYILIATARLYRYDMVKRFGNMVFEMEMPPRYCDRQPDEARCLTTIRVRGTRFVTLFSK
jgi:hypothetical protein